VPALDFPGERVMVQAPNPGEVATAPVFLAGQAI
jgi:hypothetical protein